MFKSIGSTGQPDSEVDCDCLYVCICAPKNGAAKIQGTDYSCRSKMDITNANESNKQSISNSEFSKTVNTSNSRFNKIASSSGESESYCCVTCTPQDENHPLAKFWNSSNFASRLFGFCLRKPKCLPTQLCNVYNAHNINMECYDKILDINLKIFTAKELKEHDLQHINDTMQFFSTKGLVTDEFLINLEKTMKENGYFSSEIVRPNDHRTSDALKHFNYAGNKFYIKEYSELVENMNSLKLEKKIPDAIFAKIMEPIEKGDVIQSKLNITECLYCPSILNHLNTLNDRKLLTGEYFYRYIELKELAEDLCTEMTKLSKKIIDLPKMMEEACKVLLRLEVCSSGHNTPFCERCGLQSSWLKTFKKKGIQIMEANNDNNRLVWHNGTGDK